MDSQAVALLIAIGGLVLGAARLAISILDYRLDARRARLESEARDGDPSQRVGAESTAGVE